MKGEFREILLGLLGEHNTQLAHLIALANNDENLADVVNDEPHQRAIQDGTVLRTRTKITKRLWCVVVFDERDVVISARLEDEQTGERMEFHS